MGLEVDDANLMDIENVGCIVTRLRMTFYSIQPLG